MVPLFDAEQYRFPSRRKVVYGRRGMVCSSQPLAAQAGLEILKAGGNAVDAAVAAAACITVTEPTSNGIGADAFALIYSGNHLYGLNGSGPSPALADPEVLRRQGIKEMPARGWIPVNVPGAVSAWAEAVKRFGKLSLKEVLRPAVEIAEQGHPVSPTVSTMWKGMYKAFEKNYKEDTAFKAYFDTFSVNGHAPEPGDVWYAPDHAATLREIAETEGESFYRGSLARTIGKASEAQGGWLREEDLSDYRAEWQEPINVNYHGYEIWEMPPNGHGIVALMALGILDELKADGFGSTETVHLQLEAMKLAFADGQKYITDPKDMRVRIEEMLDPEYLGKRRSLIGKTARFPEAGDPSCGGTIYLCTADGEGNMVSWIQSNYQGFGSGIVIPHTGIAMNDRGANFSLDNSAANCLAPKKKSYHTIIPGFMTKNGKAIGPFGVMGGFMQPQGHVQVIMNTLEFGMNPQEALDAPRWQWIKDNEIQVETGFSESVIDSLRQRGHIITVMQDSMTFGRGQIIWRRDDGTLIAGSEPRTDGLAAPW